MRWKAVQAAGRRGGVGVGPWWITLIASVLVLLAARMVEADEEQRPADPAAEALFAHKVLPLLKEKCFVCHGADAEDIRGQLNMQSREGLLRGGETAGPAIVPGRPDESPLYLAVRWEMLEMPPKENDRLTAEQIDYIGQWIAAGAPWPDEQRVAELLHSTEDRWSAAGGVTVNTSGGLSDEWTQRRYDPENLWAYRPLRFETPQSQGHLGHPIDTFLDAQLAELGLTPAPAADRRTLIRRATFDLLGLPPTPAEIDAFVHDPAPDDEAFGTVVERLLASPHYGEQWGKHWLDVVRYADSSGYANDYERGNAWRYRDYVVRAFNEDKPYDQFIREQIAGDEIDPTDPELLIAVGFLRMGPWELTGMEVAKVARQRFLDDVTDAVGQVFLGHMLQCARCHDHKFDPVPTRDYYAMQAVFATTQLAEREAAFLPQENTGGFGEQKYLTQRRQFYQQVLQELEEKISIEAARRWYEENGIDSTAFEEALAELNRQAPQRRKGKIGLNQVRKLMAERDVHPDQIPPRHVGFQPRDFGMERIARKGLERLKWRLERYEPFALSVYSGRTPKVNAVSAPIRVPEQPQQSGELEQTCILTGGDPFSPQQPVEPGVLSAAHSLSGTALEEAHLPDAITGRRTALAEWIAREQNPLTARVMVNRVWQWHFGQALAGNPNNFGTTGKKPTHPELLDWLAARFIEEGWSVKSLHRLIMSSAAYRRASQHPQPQAVAERDPHGTSYAAFQVRRLEAEELRDAMLTVSGELNPGIGGIPVRPEMNQEAALQPRQVMGTFAEAWQPSALPEQRHRRSLYALRIRGQRDPFAEVFNAPSADLSCEAREESTVTPQVFALFNSALTYGRALAMADRVLQEHEQEQEQRPPAATIERLFQLAFGRSATSQEIDRCLAHWEQMTDRHRELTFEPSSVPTEVVREAVEENTGEKFTFVEPLEFYADFVPDLKPSDASPTVRGLAEVCLVLLNSNEFAYIY